VSLTFTPYRYAAFFRSIRLLVGILFFYFNTNAQNLFANEGFEDLNICTEYNSPCAPEAWYYINPTTNPLVSSRIGLRPLLGNNLLLVPMHNVFDLKSTRPYVYTMFACPLTAGEKYKLTFYLNTVKRKFYNLDFYLSDKEPAGWGFDTKNLAPTFSITTNDIVADMKQDWKAIEYYFTATGNEQFCMLGNLSKTMEYKIEDKMNASGTVFYFLDEIRLISVNNKPVCEAYEDNIKKIYAQNSRHTEHALVDSEAVKPKPPKFITDTINIPAVFFESNSARLKPSFKKIMDSIAHVLEQKKLSRIDIIGHTDNKGKPADNMVLSLNRAQAVKDQLMLTLPRYADICFIAGKGQDEPKADNSTEKGRAINRRVEIIITIIDEVK